MNDIQPPSAPKILIVRLSSIGDIVLTTPVIRCVKQQVPHVEVHFLVKKGNEPLLQHNPYVDKLHVYDGNKELLINELKQENFDYIADLQKSRRSRKLLKKLGCERVTFPKCNFRKAVLVGTKMNFLPEWHIVDRYFEAVKPLQVSNDGQGLDFFIPESEKFDVQELPAGFEDGYIAVSVGAKHGTKRIPVSKIIEIGSLVFKPMILLGDQHDRAAAEEIAARLNVKVLNACGQHSILSTASIVEQSDCVLTADTGIMHIAAALHKPIASLWGNTVPELGMYPYIAPGAPEGRIFEVPYLKCRPCSKLGFEHCPLRHFKCMNLISSYEVADWINQF